MPLSVCGDHGRSPYARAAVAPERVRLERHPRRGLDVDPCAIDGLVLVDQVAGHAQREALRGPGRLGAREAVHDVLLAVGRHEPGVVALEMRGFEVALEVHGDGQVGHAVRLLRTVEVDEVDLRLAVAVVPESHEPR